MEFGLKHPLTSPLSILISSFSQASFHSEKRRGWTLFHALRVTRLVSFPSIVIGLNSRSRSQVVIFLCGAKWSGWVHLDIFRTPSSNRYAFRCCYGGSPFSLDACYPLASFAGNFIQEFWIHSRVVVADLAACLVVFFLCPLIDHWMLICNSSNRHNPSAAINIAEALILALFFKPILASFSSDKSFEF